MRTINVYVSWCNKNFGASFDESVPGAVAFTADTFIKLQKEAKETLEFHIDGMLEDGDDVPQWLADGDYQFDYKFLDMASLIRSLEPYIPLAAISRATGINQYQLSHYANGIKNPRPEQRQRIINGIHSIGERLMAIV